VLLFIGLSKSYANDTLNYQLKLHGFLDIYYGYDFNKPKNTQRLPFLYNHNRHNQFALNLGTIGVEFTSGNLSSKLTFQTGSYVEDNYSTEPGLTKLIHEASVKYRFKKNGRFSSEIGILPSHLGLESAPSFDNPTLTRSLVAENSPYYMAGLRNNFHASDSLTISVLILNGWQRIAKQEGNSLPAFGTQFNWQASKNFMVNWSTFVGSVYPDSLRRMRYYNNIFGIWKWCKKSNVFFGFDLGIEQRNKQSKRYDFWYSPFLIMDYSFNNNFKIAARGELFNDTKGIQIKPQGFNGANIWGTSLNLDYTCNEYLKFRIEGKLYFSELDIFTQSNETPASSNAFICAGLSWEL